MVWCILLTALATWLLFGIYSIATTHTFSNISDIFVLSFAYFFHYFGYAVGLAIFILLGFTVYLTIDYIKQTQNEKIEQKKQEIEDEIWKLEGEYDALKKEKEHEIDELRLKIGQYLNTLNEINDIQDKTGLIFEKMIRSSYNFIISKEKLLDALRSKRAKQLETALKRGIITKKGAERARKKFNNLLNDTENLIKQEEKTFSVLVGNTEELLKKLEQIRR